MSFAFTIVVQRSKLQQKILKKSALASFLQGISKRFAYDTKLRRYHFSMSNEYARGHKMNWASKSTTSSSEADTKCSTIKRLLK